MRFTHVDGVYFTEQELPGQVLGKIRVAAPTQNTTLSEVKKEMARKARALGGNCVAHFQYGQKADRFFSWRWDTERIVGTGNVVFIDPPPTEVN